MSVENGVIKEPINIRDPYHAMGVGTYNGVFDLAYINSNTHGKTNKWSQNKPYKVGGPDDLINIPMDKGLEFTPTPYNPIENVLPFAHNVYYKHPEIGSDFSRITDWIGYNHNSKPPLDFGWSELEWNMAVDATGYIVSNPQPGVSIPITSLQCEIPNKFLMPISKCHLYVNIFNKDKNKLIYNHLLSDDEVNFKTKITIPTLEYGEYWVYFGFDSYLYKDRPDLPLDRYTFSFTDSDRYCPNPMKLKVHFTKIYDFTIVGYKKSLSINYKPWLNTNSLSFKVFEIETTRQIGFDSKLEINNMSNKTIKFDFGKLEYKTLDWYNPNRTISYPSTDMSKDQTGVVYDSINNTLTIDSGIRTAVNVYFYNAIPEGSGIPIGVRNISFNVLYNGTQFDSGNIDIEIS